jgi:hypothetical protein
MAKIIAEHEKFGKVLLDTISYTYEYLPIPAEKYFYLDNKREVFFDTITKFLDSDSQQAVVPFVCSDTGIKGRRTFCELIDWDNRPFKLFNVEMINSRWVNNNIINFRKHTVYFVIIRKNNNAVNDFLVMSAISISAAIKKRDATKAPP